jgi:LacI family transcriptional regulator
LKVRIKDIAEKASVSIGTVDRVIHNRGEVSPETRDRVLQIIHDMQYKPDYLARALKSKKSFRVGVIIPDGSGGNEFWKSPLKGIDEALEEILPFELQVDYHLFDQFRKESFVERSHQLLNEQPHGVMVAPVFFRETYSFLNRLKALNIPFVLINSNINHPAQQCFIGQDSMRSGQLAAHLMSYGLPAGSEVIIINIARERDNYNHIKYREEGFKQFFSQQNMLTRISLVRANINSSDKRDLFKRLEKILFNGKQTGGIFVTNSRVYAVAEFLDKNKMYDLKLIGYDLIDQNIRYLEKGIIDFLISQKPKEQGYAGIMSLFNLLVQEKKPEPETYIPIDIITTENLEYYIN